MNACAGRLSRVSNRPHPLCRGCALFAYGMPGGIRPDWMDQDGVASCGSRVVHAIKVVDEPQNRAPTR